MNEMGRPRVPLYVGVSMDWNDKKTHLQLGAWFNALYGLFNLTGALFFFAIFGGFGALFGSIGIATLAVPAALVGLLFFALGLLISVLIALPFLVNIAAAVGLAWYPDEVWTSVVSIIAALLALPVFPFGTLLGIHTFVVVLWEPLMSASGPSKQSATAYAPAY